MDECNGRKPSEGYINKGVQLNAPTDSCDGITKPSRQPIGLNGVVIGDIEGNRDAGLL